MQFTLYAIAAVLGILALPYLIALWNVRHMTMVGLRIEPANETDLPEHLKAMFNPAIAELERQNFNRVSWHQLEQGAEKDGKQWGVLLQHESGQTYAGLMISPLINSAMPLIVSFTTPLSDQILLSTVNSPDFGIFSPNPQEITQHLSGVAIADQWQMHQAKLAELSQTKQAQILPAQVFLTTLMTRNKTGIERLVETGEVQWVNPGNTYRMTCWTAVRAVYQIARKQKTLTSSNAQSTAIASPTSETTTLAIEREIEAFHRLEQQQKRGISQRARNYLLLGTLALFIASYSWVFDPQRLFIFVAVLLLHESGHILAMRLFGYRDPMMLFIPFLGALATARKTNASLTEKVWISLAGPLPGLALGIGLAIAFGIPALASPTADWLKDNHWIRETSWMLIILNLFNLLPVYPLDSIPASFRLAQLNSRFRQDLRTIPPDDREAGLRFLLTQLQAPRYRSLTFVPKYHLVNGLLEAHQENTARWQVRTALTALYLVSLLTGFAGGLYALIPNWTIWSNLWTLMVYRWNPERAYRQETQKRIEAANRALQANPKDGQAYLKRGRAKIMLKDYQGAIADANQMLQLNPNSIEAYYLRGLARARSGDQAGATADQEKWSALTEQQQRAKLNQELATVNQTLSQNPQDSKSSLQRATLYYELKRYPAAISDCNRILRSDPKNTDALLLQGQAYLGSEKYAAAIAAANQVLSFAAELF